jgi:hypothetical protein
VQHPTWGGVSYPIPTPKAALFPRSPMPAVNCALRPRLSLLTRTKKGDDHPYGRREKGQRHDGKGIPSGRIRVAVWVVEVGCEPVVGRDVERPP